VLIRKHMTQETWMRHLYMGSLAPAVLCSPVQQPGNIGALQ
jgi:hypothetical protein